MILFCFLSGLAFSGAALWGLGRKAKVSRRREAHFPHAFLAVAVTFTLVYILNRLAFPVRPKLTAALNLAALAAIFILPLLIKRLRKKLLRRRLKAVKKHPRHAEVAALERMLKRDPLNAFCLEKLSEIYEETGEHEKALAAAQEAVKLDPSMKNKWRAEDL
ncbi:MAG: tetratricopeptide repeat protein, partial [Elusimicrobiota bacterium]|nr:tetratricopeptide repeat protein [Elusimicrobiota bacterium]